MCSTQSPHRARLERCLLLLILTTRQLRGSSWAKPTVSFPPPTLITLFYHVDLGGFTQVTGLPTGGLVVKNPPAKAQET